MKGKGLMVDYSFGTVIARETEKIKK